MKKKLVIVVLMLFISVLFFNYTAFANVKEMSNERLEELLDNLQTRLIEWETDQLKMAIVTAALKDLNAYIFSSQYFGIAIFGFSELYRAYDFATMLQQDILKDLIYVVKYMNSLYYQQFWQFIGDFYTIDDICDLCLVPRYENGRLLTPSERMVLYYKQAGLPNAVIQQIQKYENSQISRPALASFMHLNQDNLTDTLGTNWEIASRIRRDLASDSISISMSDIDLLLKNYKEFFSTFEQEEFDELYELIEYFKAQNYSVVDTVDFIDYILDYINNNSDK